MLKAILRMLWDLLSGRMMAAYRNARPGRISGQVVVMWVGQGSDTEGDGRFVFVPIAGDPLTFHRPDGSAAAAIISPGMMYTDGGSIPKIGQMFRNMSPWGYAPAYMIHDWLFFARYCRSDGDKSEDFAFIDKVKFNDTATILAEAIKTLSAQGDISQDDFAPSIITAGVRSVFAARQWKATGGARDRRVSDKHRAEVIEAMNKALKPLPDLTGYSDLQLPFNLPNDSDARLRQTKRGACIPQAPTVRVVAHFQFGKR